MNSLKPTTALRFGALIRVSTERQEKEGESLVTQRKVIEDAVQAMGGTVSGWYGGQEHATPGYEKVEVDRLLNDAGGSGKKFDAVIVAHVDRWSRDNQKSEKGLEDLRKNHVRFFVGTQEMDLFDPQTALFLTLAVSFGQFVARLQNKKSLQSKIERSRNGRPSLGSLPYGRTWDKDANSFKIDPEKQKLIQNVAKRYLAGEKLAKLGREVKIGPSHLNSILRTRCGTEWTVRFKSPALNIEETITITIPALLEPEVIAAIQKRSAANRTYAKEQPRKGNRFLLGRVIFCAHCGCALNTTVTGTRPRYYKHPSRYRANECPGPARKSYIPAEVIENDVMGHLFDCFGNPAAVQRAIEKATPNLAKIEETSARIDDVEKLIADKERAHSKAMDLYERDVISREDATKRLTKIRTEKEALNAELDELRTSIANLPTSKAIKSIAKKVSSRYVYRSARIVAEMRSANSDYSGMSWEDARALVQAVFSGKRSDGKRMGVYVEWSQDDGGRGRWKYSIHGHLIEEIGWLPIPERLREAYFDSPSAYAQKRLVTNSDGQAPVARCVHQYGRTRRCEDRPPGVDGATPSTRSHA